MASPQSKKQRRGDAPNAEEAEAAGCAASPGNARSPSSSRRALLTAEEKLVVLDWYHANGRNQKRTAAHFHAQPRLGKLHQGTISRWLLAEPKIRAEVAAQRVNGHQIRGQRAGGVTQRRPSREKSLTHPELERCLTLWLDRLDIAKCACLSGREIKAAAVDIYDRLRVPTAQRLELSNGWLGRFQTRHGLKMCKTQSEALTAPEDALDAERRRLADTVVMFLAGERIAGTGGVDGSAGASRSLHDVWNMDETAVFSDCSPLKASFSAIAMKRRTTATTRLTVTLATNATGTERLEPLVIGRDSAPRCFRGQSAQELGFRHYASNRMAWMTPGIFVTWLQKWNQELVAAGRHVLLFVDALRAHTTDLTGITNIQVEYFSPLFTHCVQPCSVGVSSIFHVLYRRSVVLLAAEKLCKSVESDSSGGRTLFALDQLEAMALVKTAWQEVTPEFVATSWVQSGFLPSQTQRPEPTSAIHHCIDIAVAQESGRLQQALHVLQMEAQSRNLTLECVGAEAFSQLGLADAECMDLSIEEVVQIVTENENAPAEKTGLSGDGRGGDDGGGGGSVSLGIVLQAQNSLERYWQQHQFEIAPEAQRVLQKSRRQLQQDCSGVR